jgi:hypothetical protein
VIIPAGVLSSVVVGGSAVVRPLSGTPVVLLTAVVLVLAVACVFALSFVLYRRSGRR